MPGTVTGLKAAFPPFFVEMWGWNLLIPGLLRASMFHVFLPTHKGASSKSKAGSHRGQKEGLQGVLAVEVLEVVETLEKLGIMDFFKV